MRVEKTCVLFGKSGYGKSSILQAGVLPRLAAECLPIEVRFGEYIAGQSLPPLENLRLALAKRALPNPETTFARDLPDSLWVHFKKYRSTATGGGYLLVFDQFEEFFSYPAEQQRAFREQLAELLNDELPENLREATRELPREQRRLLATASDIRLLIALRSDRLHELDRMKDYLPTLLHKRYELRALSREQAREAVLGPASLKGDFASPAFSYADAAIQRILTDLSRSNTTQQATGVEAFQLQILCDSIESKVAAGRVPDRDGDGRPDVMPEDLPDFSEVFGQYYERRLAQLPEQERDVARRVIEDGLVRLDPATGEGRRLSVDGDALLQQFGNQGLTTGLLRALEGTFLLRREPNTLGGYNYELSHDTLLAPITAAAKVRRQREEEERLRLEAEANVLALAEERRKLAQARKRTAIALVLALLAVAASIFAFLKTQEAERAKKDAVLQAENARNEKTEAEKQRGLAVISKNATETQRKIAEDNFLLAQTKTKEAETKTEEARVALAQQKEALANVVRLTLKEADVLIYHLDYEGALQKVNSAAALEVASEEVARSLIEIAFFFHETGQTARADSLAADVARLLGRTDLPPDLTTFKKLSNLPTPRPVLDKLRARYYGEFVDVPGGQYAMSETYTAEISSYKIATTETTFFQWALYAAATGKKVTEYSPSWGLDGDNPVVNVSWYDAVEYANWLSVLHNLTPAYQIDSLSKDPNNKNDYDPYKWTVTHVSFPTGESRSRAGYRLPTETEWQYAATNAGRDAFEFAGDSILQNVGWYGDNSALNGVSRTHPVAGKNQNGLRLYDMSGNVWEWCWDWYGSYPAGPVKDYRGPDEGSGRVRRGGSWGYDTGDARVGYRFNFYPSYRLGYCGFRLARAR